MFEYISELNRLCDKKNRTQAEEERLTELMIREKVETDVMLHPEDYEF